MYEPDISTEIRTGLDKPRQISLHLKFIVKVSKLNFFKIKFQLILATNTNELEHHVLQLIFMTRSRINKFKFFISLTDELDAIVHDALIYH